MSTRPVDAVFFWHGTGIGTFKAVYGRKPKVGGKARSYTKDFHQPRKQLARALEKVLGVEPGGSTRLEWRWPGGSDPHGLLKPAADYDQPGGRMNLRWETDSAPPPWRLTPHPSATSTSTLEGEPDHEDEADADAQLDALKTSGENPWLIAVHRVGEGPVLHARIVLMNPRPGREFASWHNLPQAVRDEMTTLTNRDPGGYVLFESGAPLTDLVKRILDAFNDSPNVLVVGPPGTGKTVAMEQIAAMYDDAGGAPMVAFDDEALHGAFESLDAPVRGGRVASLLFHPSYAYEHFVMGLLPQVVEEGVGITVAPHVGPLLELAHYADRPGHSSLLLLDEFNRGNAAAIFGDTLGLLDKDKRGRAYIDTPYRHLKPKIDGEPLGETTALPPTLRILAAMNSADRSVAPLDAALRRRFAIIYVEPDIKALRAHLEPEPTATFVATDPNTWSTPGDVREVAIRVLEAINRRIEFVLGRDFLLGQSVFWHVEGNTFSASLGSLATALDNRVLGTLTLTFTDEDEALAKVLNIGDKLTPPAVGEWRDAPPGLERWGRRLLIGSFGEFADDTSLATAIAALLDPSSDMTPSGVDEDVDEDAAMETAEDPEEP